MTASTQNLNAQDLADEGLLAPTPRHPASRLEADWLFLYEKLPPKQWLSVDYIYKTSFWLSIHADIRKRQHALTQISDAYHAGDIEWSEYRSQTSPRINQYIFKFFK